MRKRLLPFLLFDQTASDSTSDSAAPLLPSVFGDSSHPNSDCDLPLFPEMTDTDQRHLQEYFHTCETRRRVDKVITQPDKDGREVAWTGDDALNQWEKLRIFESSKPESDESESKERAVGKVVSVDNKCECNVWC